MRRLLAPLTFLVLPATVMFACATSETDDLGSGSSGVGGAGGTSAASTTSASSTSASSTSASSTSATSSTSASSTTSATSATSTTSAATSTSSGGGCDPFTCLQQCAAAFQLGQCVGNVCECSDILDGGGLGGFGFGGGFP